MQRIHLSIVALFATFIAMPLMSGCIDEDELEWEDSDFRSQDICPGCFLDPDFDGSGFVILNIASAYNASSITNVTVEIANAAATETIDYGSTLSVPNEPSDILVEDSDLTTVGASGAAPTSATITYVLQDASGTTTLSESLGITDCPRWRCGYNGPSLDGTT